MTAFYAIISGTNLHFSHLAALSASGASACAVSVNIICHKISDVELLPSWTSKWNEVKQNEIKDRTISRTFGRFDGSIKKTNRSRVLISSLRRSLSFLISLATSSNLVSFVSSHPDTSNVFTSLISSLISLTTSSARSVSTCDKSTDLFGHRQLLSMTEAVEFENDKCTDC